MAKFSYMACRKIRRIKHCSCWLLAAAGIHILLMYHDKLLNLFRLICPDLQEITAFRGSRKIEFKLGFCPVTDPARKKDRIEMLIKRNIFIAMKMSFPGK